MAVARQTWDDRQGQRNLMGSVAENSSMRARDDEKGDFFTANGEMFMKMSIKAGADTDT